MGTHLFGSPFIYDFILTPPYISPDLSVITQIVPLPFPQV